MDIRRSRLIKTIYEIPYRVRMYCLSKKLYREQVSAMTKADIEKIEKYKDIHKGERCFIVLTGPSLIEEDLGIIKDEVCFTVNSGYKAYGLCGWKPQYYVSMDGNEVAQEMLQTVLKEDYELQGVFTGMNNPIHNDRLVKLPSDVSLIWRIGSVLNILFPRSWMLGRISEDISQKVYNGKTVLCATLQIANYMGFDGIYLLGADFDYTGEKSHSDIAQEKILRKDWDKTKTETDMLVQIRDFAQDAENKGIKIFNATRGGKLDCFKRVCLDDIVT